MANETAKATRRRTQEEKDGMFPWSTILKGKALDIGCGPDLLKIPGCEGWDLRDGDCNDMRPYFPSDTFDLLHASHVLEHMRDAKASVESWLSILKPGGYLVGEVPSWELYEGKRDTSIWNMDHKSTWSMWSMKGGKILPHHYAPDFFTQFNVDVLLLRIVDTNYDYCVGASRDQTWGVGNKTECFIEFCLKKL